MHVKIRLAGKCHWALITLMGFKSKVNIHVVFIFIPISKPLATSRAEECFQLFFLVLIHMPSHSVLRSDMAANVAYPSLMSQLHVLFNHVGMLDDHFTARMCTRYHVGPMVQFHMILKI